MKRSQTLLSAAITAFTLVLGVGVGYTYQLLQAVQRQNAPASATPLPTDTALPSATATVTPLGNITPQEAAIVASQYINRTDAYSVTMSSYGGLPSYLVMFSSGDQVYVTTKGFVQDTVAPTATPTAAVVWSAPASGGGAGNNNGGGGGGGEHEDDHEGGDD